MGVQFSTVGGRKTVLLVDDVELDRPLIERILSGAGYDVNCVADGAAAVQAVDTKAYDLVLMDLEIPGVDGYQAMAAIREKKRSLPVVALTSRNRPLEKDRARDVGMNAHLSRPIAAPTLIQVVGDLVSKAVVPVSKVFRPDIQNEIVARLGFDRTRFFLDALLGQCHATQDLIARGDTEEDVLDGKAHDLASTAGMLGYEELWHGCRDLLVAPDDGARARAIAPIGAALARAIKTIEDQLSAENTAAA